MSSPVTPASTLSEANTCYFPSLIHTPPLSSKQGRCSFWSPAYRPKRKFTIPGTFPLDTCKLSLALLLNKQFTIPGIYPEDICKLALALLLKTYTQGNIVSYGFLEREYSDKNGRPRIALAQRVRADLDDSATVADNLSRLTFLPLTGSDRKEEQSTNRSFNTTLCFQPPGLHERCHEGTLDPIVEIPWESDLVFCVANGLYGATSQGCVKFRLHYSTKLLNRTRARNVLSTFESIVLAIIADNNCPLYKLDIISGWDWYRVRQWNAKLLVAAEGTLNEHLATVFRENEDDEAVFTSDGGFTYRELDDLSTNLAHRLREAGVKRNTVVPICMNRSRWTICAMIAIWKAGGTVTVIEPTDGLDRLVTIVRKLKARILISEPRHCSEFKEDGVWVMLNLEYFTHPLEADEQPIDRANAWSMGEVEPEDMAFVMWTTARDGSLRGISHTHSGCASAYQPYPWTTGSTRTRSLHAASMSELGEILRTLFYGGTVCLQSPTESVSDVAEFAQSRATQAFLPQSLSSTINPDDVPSLKVVMVGHNQLDCDLRKLWSARVRLVEVYEVLEGATMIKENGADEGFHLLEGLAWLVSPSDVDNLVPIGAVGEIVFESFGLATELSDSPANVFISPPTWAGKRRGGVPKGCRYFRTGKLGSYEQDGTISFLESQ